MKSRSLYHAPFGWHRPRLELGSWSFSGAWILDLGASNSQLLALLLLLILPRTACADPLAEGSTKIKVQSLAPFKVHAFSLQDVQLLEGPFKHAMELDQQYLLALDVERLLRNFRVNAGLPSAAQPLGGWEAPDCELRGHFVGHYLSACALMYASTGDGRLKQ